MVVAQDLNLDMPRRFDVLFEVHVADAERRSEAVSESGKALARDAAPAELSELTKAELLELADGMGLEVNSHQLKKELVTAIKRSRN